MPAATTRFFASLALVGAVSAPALVSAEAYQLDFDPPRTVGDRFHFEGEASSLDEVHTRIDGNTVTEQATEAEAFVSARCEVLAINEDGGIQQLAFEMIEYEFELNGEAFELDMSQRLIVTVIGDETSYTYEGGQAVGAGFEEALELLLDEPLDTDRDGLDVNRLMCADKPREVGETWEIDHAYMAESFAKDGEMLIDADLVTSQVALVEVSPNDAGVLMATVESEFLVESVALPAGQLPEFLKVEDSGMRVQMNGMLALDPGSLFGTQGAGMEMGFIAKGTAPDGQLFEVEAEFERKVQIQYSPIAE